MLKKHLCVLLSIILSAGILACGASNSSGSAAGAEASSSTAASEKAEKVQGAEDPSTETLSRTDNSDKAVSTVKNAYEKCTEQVFSTGTERSDDFFTGKVYVIEETRQYDFLSSIGVAENDDRLWVLYEYIGDQEVAKDTKASLCLDGKTGKYVFYIPMTTDFSEERPIVWVKGNFDLSRYDRSNTFIPDEIVTDASFSIEPLKEQLNAYPNQLLPGMMNLLEYWLKGLGLTLEDLGISTAAGLTVSKDSDTVVIEYPANPGNSSNNSGGTFTNKFGTPTTKCAHTGCNNYIASSGDTNCCPVHSNHCADCGKYIDEDAQYCMDCIEKTAASALEKKAASSGSDKSSKSNTKKQRICPNCYGGGIVETYETNDPLEKPTYIDCPMCHGTGMVTD